MLEVRKKLPSYKMRDEIVDTVRDNQVVVISGETGELKEFKVGTGAYDLIILPPRINLIIWKQRKFN